MIAPKGGLGQFADLRGEAWQERGGGVFEGRLIPQMHIMTIWKVFLNKIQFKMLYLTLKK